MASSLALVGMLCGAGSGALGLRHRQGSTGVNRRLDALPPVLLWAWERPEDLRFLDARKQGVAYLAATVTLTGDSILVYPRHQPLRVPDGTTLVAVVRIESGRIPPPSLSAEQRRAVAGVILRTGSSHNHAAVQVDFDAVESERDFYRDLLNDLRNRLPSRTGLSMTALTSWCMGDPWIRELPVDEAVPMLFRMGADRAVVNEQLRSGRDFSLPVCRRSIGTSTDETFVGLPTGRRIYAFSPRPWETEAFETLTHEVGR